jgi:hypothetical protein
LSDYPDAREFLYAAVEFAPLRTRASDHAVTYALDSNPTRFLNKLKDLFPEYFLEVLGTEGIRDSRLFSEGTGD